jgi:hypothetical protein
LTGVVPEHIIRFMGRSLSLLATRLPSFEEDGVTHRRDCACARCDAGYGPSEHDRAEAQRRWEEKRAQAAAERALVRKRESERLKRAEVHLFVSDQVKAADEHLRELRALESRIGADGRLTELWRLRGNGLSWRQSMDEIDRRFPPPEND